MAVPRPALADPRRWSDLPREESVRAAVGPDAFARGAAYARSGRVRWVSSDPQRRVLLAAVKGTAPHPYQTLVQVGDARGVRPSSGRCSCPVMLNCKHVAAVLVAALDELGAAPPAASAWERLLAGVVEEPEPDGATGTPVSLQFEPAVEAGGYGRPATLRVRLRPVVPGKKSAWIRTGIGWRDLAYDWGARNRMNSHREALHALYQAHRPSAYSYGEQAVHLDEFGPALWPLLRAAVEAGVPLVPAKPGAGAVVLAGAPATLSLDLTGDDDGGVTAAAAVDVPGADDDVAASVALVGEPAHGVVLDCSHSGAGLVLAPLERPLTRQASALLTAGALHVPHEDVGRFLAEYYYPALRRIVAVRSPDGSVELPEIAPPSRPSCETARCPAESAPRSSPDPECPDPRPPHGCAGSTPRCSPRRSCPRCATRASSWTSLVRRSSTGTPSTAPPRGPSRPRSP